MIYLIFFLRNVANCWTYETVMTLEWDIPTELPYNDTCNFWI